MPAEQKPTSEATMATDQKPTPVADEEIPVVKKPHVLVVPYPTPGHINPLLQFSRRLQHKGVKVTLANTQFIHDTMHDFSGSDVDIETFSDGKEEAGEIEIRAYLDRLEEIGYRTLTHLIERLRDRGTPVDCIVYDSFLTWVQDVARDFEVVAAVFFTQSCAVSSILYHFDKGVVKPTDTEFVIPGLPAMEPSEVPSFIYDEESYWVEVRRYLLNQFCNFDKADWIFFNTLSELEHEVLEAMQKQWPVRTVGPTVPSMYLDKRIEQDKEYGMNLFNPNSEVVMKWLDQRAPDSVAYIAFGSLITLSLKQMEELAMGLKASNKHFLWVVRASEQEKLPANFREETAEKGLVVSWASQLDVLAHKAVACFVTHCGWNSTLESLSLGVPMVAMGEKADQVTNAKLSMDVWKNGIRPKRTADNIVSREELEYCLNEIMEGERGKEIKKNATMWKEVAIEAVSEGGSSDKNISDFITSLIRH